MGKKAKLFKSKATWWVFGFHVQNILQYLYVLIQSLTQSNTGWSGDPRTLDFSFSIEIAIDVGWVPNFTKISHSKNPRAKVKLKSNVVINRSRDPNHPVSIRYNFPFYNFLPFTWLCFLFFVISLFRKVAPVSSCTSRSHNRNFISHFLLSGFSNQWHIKYGRAPLLCDIFPISFASSNRKCTFNYIEHFEHSAMHIAHFTMGMD